MIQAIPDLFPLTIGVEASMPILIFIRLEIIYVLRESLLQLIPWIALASGYFDWRAPAARKCLDSIGVAL